MLNLKYIENFCVNGFINSEYDSAVLATLAQMINVLHWKKSEMSKYLYLYIC